MTASNGGQHKSLENSVRLPDEMGIKYHQKEGCYSDKYPSENIVIFGDLEFSKNILEIMELFIVLKLCFWMTFKFSSSLLQCVFQNRG